MIRPTISRGQLVAWSVTIDGESVDVLPADLPAPLFPTEHQILHTARRKLGGLPACNVRFALAMDDAFAMALDEWERTETTRRACVRLCGIDYRRAAKIENSYLDHSSVLGFDEAAKSAAIELPELGWNPDDDNGAALWEIVSQRPLPKPKRTDATVRNAAIDMLQTRHQAQQPEAVPF